jgi:hypothetical protein
MSWTTNKSLKQGEPGSYESRKRTLDSGDYEPVIRGKVHKYCFTQALGNTCRTQNSISQSSIQQPGDFPDNITFCTRCQSIDFKKIFTWSLGDHSCIPILNLKKMTDAERNPSCQLCQLCQLLWNLWEARPIDAPYGYESNEYEDRWLAYVSWANAHENGATPAIDGPVLAILPSKQASTSDSWDLGYAARHYIMATGYIGEPESNRSFSKFHVRSVQPNSIDYLIVREWLGFCELYHKNCMPSSVDFGNSFRLIDCRKGCGRITTFPAGSPVPRYLALSYVWGAQADQNQNQAQMNQLPNKIPQTIKDSITVTQELGFDWLWIDRYCIWQYDVKDKQAQIHLMSKIYSSAQATIIAAAGSDPSYGLPGVGEKSRIPQSQVKIGARTLCWTMEHSSSLLSKSVWMTRAWTYQEALLSRRRLIFTDKQLYFECSNMNCCESKNEPQRTGANLDKLKYDIIRRRMRGLANIGRFLPEFKNTWNGKLVKSQIFSMHFKEYCKFSRRCNLRFTIFGAFQCFPQLHFGGRNGHPCFRGRSWIVS